MTAQTANPVVEVVNRDEQDVWTLSREGISQVRTQHSDKQRKYTEASHHELSWLGLRKWAVRRRFH